VDWRLHPDPGKEIVMLQVTDAAVSVLKREVLREGDEDASARAVRIHTAATSNGQQALAIQPVEGPQSGDVPTEAADLDVFISPELAAPLDSAVLDARETPEGVQIFLREQSWES
jgi:hypothetical protein